MFDLKDAIPAEALQPGPPSGQTYSALPTRVLDDTGPLSGSSSATQILQDSRDPEPTGEPFRNFKLSRNEFWRTLLFAFGMMDVNQCFCL